MTPPKGQRMGSIPNPHPSSPQTRAKGSPAMGSILLSAHRPVGGGALRRCLMGNNRIWSQVQLSSDQ